MELNRLDYIILKLLYKKKCLSHFDSMTIQEIMDITKTSRTTTYRKVMNLEKNGYLKKGCKSIQADTFYLLEKAIKLIESKGEINND